MDTLVLMKSQSPTKPIFFERIPVLASAVKTIRKSFRGKPNKESLKKRSIDLSDIETTSSFESSDSPDNRSSNGSINGVKQIQKEEIWTFAKDLEQHVFCLSENRLVKNYVSTKGYGETHRRLADYVKVNFNPGFVNEILLNVHNNRRLTTILNPKNECFAIATLQALFACPPFVDYIEKKKPVSLIDDAMRVIAAQVRTGWIAINCTGLLKLLMNYQEEKEEDAEDFYRALEEKYFDATFRNPTEYKTFECNECYNEEMIIDKGTRISLPPPFKFHNPARMRSLVAYKIGGLEQVEKTCRFCGEIGGCFQTIWDLGNLLFVSAASTHTDGRIAKFENRINLKLVENLERNSYWNLGGVVYYEQYSKFHGHYVTVVRFRDKAYLMNDMYLYEIPTASVKGKPYFALYYREDWFIAQTDV
ncbi:hypothetical protein GCK72_023379 [Caenorhabditis remanei]|uniref:USP domain-containing protein n=1 Tax=Caenorhabditis remanei TaxID=31234 RepID=A0A6A5FWT8_CAERE|nr:hypothetical protein GCK72_023379 [Caenorhabditis remanei]KAF1746921.1 hypothetical protein GCK72_023379 [Caenorhabditis remanei]